ncbi:hypothetical protein IAQ61_011627 [Plenodomus lingam]|uniref:uncharacterized protein n=1 Tax=Leptosphaeria maculans TaxID=5022 RepID=UPI00332FA857|nr:hypothetical protein IAQ61_011627 [Plenodomus lingam]
MFHSTRSAPFSPPPPDLDRHVLYKSFPFLKLPKDIRLMVYENLPITTNLHLIPSKRPHHYITLVNPSISGIRILATCRQINQEASHILKPHLTRILKTPPEIQIAAKDLIGLLNFDDSFRYEYDILDRILRAVKVATTLQSIHGYRKSGSEEAYLTMKSWLRVRGLLDNEDRVSAKALATFVLRAHEYRKTYPSTFYK